MTKPKKSSGHKIKADHEAQNFMLGLRSKPMYRLVRVLEIFKILHTMPALVLA